MEKDLIIFDAKTFEKEEFLAKYQNPFLIQFIQLTPQQAFGKTSIFVGSIDLEAMKNPKEIKNIFIIEKSGRNSFSNKIIVGRAPVQDLIISDAKISKFHAYFEIRNGLYYVVDHGSTNGSRLNNEKLEDSIPVAVNDGDIITFGSFSYTYYSPEAAYQVLRSF